MSSSSNSFVSEDMSKVSLSSTSELEAKNLKQQLISELNTLLRKLMTHKYGWVFSMPVDGEELGLSDYLDIVKKPMDLSTVKAKLLNGSYSSPLEFAEDVRLTFNNAILYSRVGNDVHLMAKLLLSMFEEKWVSVEGELDNLHRSLERAESMTTPVEPETVTTTTTTTTTTIEKPREEEEEANVDNRDLTHDEKRRLSEELQDTGSGSNDSDSDSSRGRGSDTGN